MKFEFTERGRMFDIAGFYKMLDVHKRQLDEAYKNRNYTMIEEAAYNIAKITYVIRVAESKSEDDKI